MSSTSYYRPATQHQCPTPSLLIALTDLRLAHRHRLADEIPDRAGLGPHNLFRLLNVFSRLLDLLS